MYCYQRDQMQFYGAGLHAISKYFKHLLLNENFSFHADAHYRALGAVHDIIYRWTRPNHHPSFNIDPVMIEQATYVITEHDICDKAFCTLKFFKKEGYPKYQPSVLVVAPLSAHYATLVNDTVHTLLQDHNVYLTDWKNASHVPLSEGYFDLDTYVDYLKEFYTILGPDLHVLAVCQPCVPVLMATASMAQENDPHSPKSMILMGGPVDTRINPTVVNKTAESLPLDWFETYMVAQVPYYTKGAGRHVTPGNLILGGFMAMNLQSHVKKHYQHIVNVVHNDEKAINAHQEFYDEYLTVMDLPAEYFINTIDVVFQKHLLPKHQITYKGNSLDFKAIHTTALMTIEGENDDITGLGQTYAAHHVCSNIPEYRRDHFLRLDVGHYGIFSGSRWRKDIYPQIFNFIQKNL